MKAKRFLCSILAFALVLSTMGFTVLAEDTDIIEVGAGKTYETWSAAIATATDANADGSITYHIYGKVLMDSHDVKGAAATINIIGMTDDAELSVETANPTDNGVVYVSDNTIETVNFSNLKLSRPNGEYRGNEGHHNRFFTVWDSDDSTDLITYTSCVFPNGAGNNQYGKTTYTDCDFYNDVYYALWIYGSGDKGVVEVTGGTFDADRGVKIYSEDPSATVKTTIKDSTFDIASKPAIVSSIAGELVVEDVDATECEYGLLASEPKDGSSDLESAAITVDGEEPVFVAKVGNMVCTDMAYAEAESSESKPVEIPVAKIGTKHYATLQAAIDAATDGDTVIVKEGTYEVPSMKAGITVEGKGNVVLEGTLSGNLKNLTLKNLYIKGSNAQRWAYAKGEYLTFENVTFHATGVYAIHFDGIETGINLTYKNCTIIGWAAMGGSPGSCVFDGCTIRDNGTYGVVRTYFDAEFKDCTFDVDAANQDDVYQDGLHVVDAVMKVNNCTNANGNIEDILNISNDAYIFVDDEIALAPENKTLAANIGFDVYETLQAAIDAATESDTIVILDNLSELADIVNAGNDLKGITIKLGADFDLAGENWTPIGVTVYNNKYAPADANKTFRGVFDGNNKVISNLKIEKILNQGADAVSNVGLFGYIGEGAIIKDLTITNVNINTDGRNVGALAGIAYKSTFENITVNGDIQISGGNNVSGVCAMTRYYNVSAIDITVCGEDGSSITGNNIVGGIFAEIAPNGSEQTFKNLSVENVAINGVGGVGGIAGLITNGAVSNVSVKNVALTGRTDYQGDAMGRIRLGSIAGLLGGSKSTIANVDVDNVTAKNLDGTAIELPVIGANYDSSSNATEAKIGDTYYATLTGAIEAAQAGDTIDLLGNVVDLPEVKGLKITKDITIENGTVDITNGTWNGNSIIEVCGGTAGNPVIAAFNDVDFVGDNYSSAFGVIYAHSHGKVIINGCDFNLSNEKYSAGGVLKGNGVDVSAFDVTNSTFDLENPNRIIANATVNLESVKIDAVVTDDTLVVGEMNNHAFRNVVGNVNDTDIYVDGFETGIKNTVDNEVLTVTDSTIKVTNAANGNPGIYLTGRDKLVDINSTIDAKIFIDVVEGEDVVLNTLSFETNGGNAIPSVVRNQGEVVDLSGYKPEKSGYTFVGWYSDEALTQSVTPVTLDSPVTVYAKWNQNVTGGGSGGVARYTVVFVTNGGTSIDKISNLKNRTVDLAEYTTEKEGYTFEGWYTDKELTNKVTSVKLTDDITLYAKWVEIETQPGTDEPGTTEGGNLFADVKTADWFYENVKYVVENELMNGVDEDNFAPNDTLTRAMLVTVLYRIESEPEVKNISFTDVDADSYYANAVSWAKKNGIVNGVTESEFAPNSDITREQIATILHRYAQYKGYDVSVGENTNILSYDDAESVSEYAVSSIQYVVGSGLIKGKSATTLNPLDNATRAEIAAILQRFIEANNN